MTSQPFGKPSAGSAEQRPPSRLALIVLAVAAAGLWLGPSALDGVRAAEARFTGRPELAQACSFRHRTGLACLGCGGTRALAAVARGDLRRGFATNLLGAAVGLAAWVLLASALASLVLGQARLLYWALGLVSAALPLALLVSAVVWWQGVQERQSTVHSQQSTVWAARPPGLARKPTTELAVSVSAVLLTANC
jgi:Protein of unknown function (DUF2752)